MQKTTIEPVAADQLYVRNSDMTLVRVISVDTMRETVEFQKVKGERSRSTAALERFYLAYSRYYRKGE